MNEKFFELRREKQDRIINAALKIFGMYGYRHASTDEIVKCAQISKGLLFHYFESKMGLYAFLYDYATRLVNLELSRYIDRTTDDFFELYDRVLRSKRDCLVQYPYIFLFLKKADGEADPEAEAQIKDRRSIFKKGLEEYRDRADITVLPAGTDYVKIWNIMDYATEGILEEHVANGNLRPELFYEEAKEYVELIKNMTA